MAGILEVSAAMMRLFSQARSLASSNWCSRDSILACI